MNTLGAPTTGENHLNQPCFKTDEPRDNVAKKQERGDLCGGLLSCFKVLLGEPGLVRSDFRHRYNFSHIPSVIDDTYLVPSTKASSTPQDKDGVTVVV